MHPTGSSRAYPDQPLQQTATTPLQPPHSLAVPLSASASSSSASGSHAPPRADIASVEAISKHLKRVGKRWRGSKQCISWDFRRGSQNHEVKLTFSRLTRKLVITCDGEVVPPPPPPPGGGGGGGPAQAGAATTGGGGGPSEFPLRSRAYFFSSLGGSRFLPFRGGGIPVARWSKGDVDLEIEQTSARGERYTLKLNGEPFTEGKRGERYTLKLNGEPFTEGKLYSSSSPFPSRHFGGPTSSLPSSSSSAHQQQIIAQQQQQQQHRQMDQRQTQRQRQQKDREGSGKLNHERETASSTRGHAGRGRSGQSEGRESGFKLAWFFVSLEEDEHEKRGLSMDREKEAEGTESSRKEGVSDSLSLFSVGGDGEIKMLVLEIQEPQKEGEGEKTSKEENPPRDLGLSLWRLTEGGERGLWLQLLDLNDAVCRLALEESWGGENRKKGGG
uniref:Uncharacterized protein n=1 Tax=Chromera velia CCMP2878 TaxID=1169474 RepID=A0A0G4HJJ1_9ALVE|eukprot:Cvel_28283.t1-p1 / transcript=Cvel_28283.t1 / gene=Cvel_28283 / organism=Chromera_velia_CCMP2878 / gene_product=hypothetical protein / transcript_product=hypothetical protein / location=Cvel_scaffold3667:2602-6056(-) / protein_length=443 / sequence_SO=supercontig / SO=protein_coding / is_pseudo=false